MRIVGIKNAKDSIGWVIVEGGSRAEAIVLAQSEASAPIGDRAGQLAWVRREVLEILARHPVERAAIRLAEAGQSGVPNFARAELDGVVQAALGEVGIPTRGFKSATVRGAYGRSKADAEAAQARVACISKTAKVRRDQLVVALALLPETL